MPRVRTYTYIEPDDDAKLDTYSDPIDGPDTIVRSAGNKPDFDAGWTEGYKAGFFAGYERARQQPLASRDTKEEGGASRPLLV